MNILVLNCGSSSIKYTLYDGTHGEVIHHGLSERVTDYDESLETLFDELEALLPEGLSSVMGVGHRVVHGGRRFTKPQVVDADVLEAIRECAVLAPLHNPHNIRGMEFSAARMPHIPQVAVFDTTFHASMPRWAHTYALPAVLFRRHRIRRYGFHGISHNYVHDRALAKLGCEAEGLSIITCHLGNGCSVAAIEDGLCVDTSMGFTPLEGLVMGTRCGDLDPAVVIHLLSEDGGGMRTGELHGILNRESGLLGLSGLSSDVRDLLRARDKGHEGAALALKVFTYRLKKYICAYHGILGGADALVFTAGTGENSPDVRSESLDGLGQLGFILDESRNRDTVGREGEISAGDSAVKILVIPTDEDRMIFMETLRVLETMRTAVRW